MNQQTPEWFAVRAGKVTASRFCDVLAKIKVGESRERAKYRWELVAERLTGEKAEGYSNRAMERGTELEPFARMAYEAHTKNMVEEAGFIVHPSLPYVGCSPDGLIGDDGGLEIKCPASAVIHIQTIQGGMPSEHRAQVQGAMWVTGRAWWDFVSYDPRMPEKLRLYVERVKRNEEYIKALAEEVAAFQAEVERQFQSLMELAA